MRQGKHVARIGERRGAYSVLVGSLRERCRLEDPGLLGRVILRCICGMCDGGGGMDWIDLA